MSKYGHLPHNYFEDLMNRLGGEEGAERFKRGELRLVAAGRQLRCLTLANPSVAYSAAENVDPHTFFKIRAGLWVPGDFARRVLAKAQPTSAPATTGKSYGLTKNANDHEIEADLGEGHVFADESTFCAYLAQMIEVQWGGKEGDLQNDGSWNLFYLSSCVVSVRWAAGHGEWRVVTWEPDGDGWSAGDRAFSGN